MIGGPGVRDRNVIVGNVNDGIGVLGGSSIGNVIQGNSVGVNAPGTGAIANAGNGIYMAGGANNTQVTGNVCSGNEDDGIEIQDPTSTNNQIQGNRVGTDPTGTFAIKNGDVGVLIENAPGNQIGGRTLGTRNIISGNKTDGVRIAGVNAIGNHIEGNLIGADSSGTTPLPNLVHGVRFTNDSEGPLVGDPRWNTIGGTGAGALNVILGNLGTGVSVVRGALNAILGNAISGNGALGIDLGGNGVTANDGTKNPALPNSDMDFPVFTGRSLVGTQLTVAGFVGSAAGQSRFANARVEILQSDIDASGYGQGRLYPGLAADSASSGSFSGTLDVTGMGLTAGDAITATATDSLGNTSEFARTMPLVATLRGTVFEDVNYGGARVETVRPRRAWAALAHASSSTMASARISPPPLPARMGPTCSAGW